MDIHFQEYFTYFGLSFIFGVLRYFLIAGGAYLFFWKVFSKAFSGRFILKRLPKFNPTMLFEIKQSIKSLMIFSFLGSVTLCLALKGGTLSYWDSQKYGKFYLFFSFFLLLFLHDAYFYWIHRLIHHRKLFRVFHKTHHISRSPTPWTSYSFDVGEAFLNSLFFFLIPFLIPIYPGVLFGFFVFSLLYNVLAHLGYELYPKRMRESFLVSTTHHYLHHQRGNCNYGFYFRFWDKVMGTDFEQKQ